MKNFQSIIILVSVLASLLSGCTKAPGTGDNVGLVPLSFNTSIDAPSTKTPGIAGTQFSYDIYRSAYDNASQYYSDYLFALWICNEGTIKPHMTGFTNMKCLFRAYNTGESSICIPSDNTDGTQQTFAKIGKGIDIFSYYPHNASCTDPHKLEFTTNGQTDWMWCEPVHYTPADTESAVNYLETNLKFHHAMTCVEIWLESWYSTSVNVNSITLTDTKGKLVASGVMDGTSGELSALKYTSSIKLSGNNSSHAGGNTLRNVTQDGGRWQKYSFIMPEYSDFDGTNLTLSFVFDQTGPGQILPIAGRKTYMMTNILKDADDNPITISGFETGKRYVYQLRLDNTLLIEPLHQYMPEWTTVEKQFWM